MLSKHRGGELVGKGTYLGIRSGEFISVQEREQLPGTAEASYRKVPLLALLVVGPLLGLAFVIFLPAAAPVALAYVAVGKVRAKMGSYRQMLQRQYYPGEALAQGAYINLRSWELVTVEEGDTVETVPGTRYMRIPVAAVLLLGPFVGLVFVLLLPMLVPIVLAILILHKVQASTAGLRAMSLPMAVSRQPGLAYLQPRREKDAQENNAETESDGQEGDVERDSLVHIAEEIARRRQEGQK